MRWLYQDSAEPPYIPPVALDWDCLLGDMVQKPYPKRQVQADAHPRKPPPGIYTIFDAFELTAWETPSSSMMAASMAASSGNGKGGKGGGNGDTGKGKGGSKSKKYGDYGWVIGDKYPPPISEYPWGDSGTPPTEQTVYMVDGMKVPRLARGAPLALPLQGRREPLFFGETRMRLDWETPLSIEVRHRHTLRVDEQFEADVPRLEEITLDKWYVPFTQWMLPLPWRLPPLESFQNLETDEAPQVDKYDTPLTRVLPWRPKMPVSVMPCKFEGDNPLAETVTLDKWYSPLQVPMRLPPWIRLRLGELNLEPIPDDPEVLLQLLLWRNPDRLPVRPVLRLVPEMSFFPGDTEKGEQPHVDKYDSPLTTLLPWRPKMPISLFPFREEGEPPQGETITLDKWYTPLAYPSQKLANVSQYAVTSERQPFQALPWVYTDETVESSKWYTALSHPVWPPPILTLMLGVLGEEPIPDIPGLPIDYWLTLLQQPLNQLPVLPVLYQPLQYLYDQPYIREVPWPRRRPDKRHYRRRS
jgi:hypothetical protein